jgi:hypothetical protein
VATGTTLLPARRRCRIAETHAADRVKSVSACLPDGLTQPRMMSVSVLVPGRPDHCKQRRRTSGSFDMISTVRELAAEALFVSDLQPSECPSRRILEDTVTAMILRYGSDGCAAGVAVEYGDHPDTAVARMTWICSELEGVVAPARRPQLAN